VANRILVCVLLAASMALGAQQPPPKPLNKDQVSAMVRDGLADEFGARLVKDRGVDFAPDAEFVESLRKAGASEAFLKAVQEALPPTGAPPAPKPLSRVQVTALVKAGIASSRIAVLVGDRGIDFEPSDDYLQQLQKAGATQEALDALRTAERVKRPEQASLHPPQGDSSKNNPPDSSANAGGRRIRVGGAVESAKLVYQESPEYPPLAKMARIQGVVRMEVLIDKDGTVEDIKVMSGHPLLIESALMTVSRWRYQPTYLNGEPVLVQTEVDVNYQLEK
jgi:TonB family protein